MAVDNGRSATVNYFVKTLEMDITEFDEVILKQNNYFECLAFARKFGL